MDIIQRVKGKLYRTIFKNKFTLNNLQSENQRLKDQLEYLKRHTDITKIYPATGLLREYQLKELAFANEIMDTLNEKNIFPFFDGGCLIGAMRHKGFIPWDDDIDLGVMRSDFDKIKEIAKNEFVWAEFDNTKTNQNIEDFTDQLLKNNDKYLFIQTPYCIHCYKGSSLLDSVNVEFFPYDYVAENVTEEDYNKYKEKVKKEVILSRPWKDIFAFYEKELDEGKVLTRKETSRIVPGLGNYAQTQYKFYGFDYYSEDFPLSIMEFENQLIPVPNNYETHIKNIYNNWKAFPKDVGISPYMQSLKDCLSKNDGPLSADDFLF